MARFKLIFLFISIAFLGLLMLVPQVKDLKSYDLFSLRALEKLRNSFGDFLSDNLTDHDYMVREERGADNGRQTKVVKGQLLGSHQKDPDYQKYPTSMGDQWNTKSYLADVSYQLGEPSLIWRRSIENFESQFNPIFFDDHVYISDARGKLTKIDVGSGATSWTRRFDSFRVAKRGGVIDPDIDVLYVGDGNNLRAINLSDGTDFEPFNGGLLTVGDEIIVAPRLLSASYVLVVTNNMKVVLADRKTGEIVNQFILSSDGAEEEQRAWGLESVYKRPRVWSGFALDSSRELMFITTSNPAPVLIGVDRPGINELSSSVVAVSPITGKIVWSFQDVSHDLWDLDVAAPPVLTSVNVDGKLIDVVAVIGKSGNVWLLDRNSGESIFDYILRNAPPSQVLGEKTAQFQKQTVQPPNLLGKRNTALISDGGLSWGFYEPPRIDEPIVVKGLHGGVMWPGFTVSEEWIATVVNHDLSLLALTRSGGADGIGFQECGVCHNNSYQPNIGRFVGTRTEGEFRSLLENGYQAMPPQRLSEDRLSEILMFLSGDKDSGLGLAGLEKGDANGKLLRAPYRKFYDGENQDPELVVINKSSGKVAYREKINTGMVKLAMGSTSIVGNQHLAVTGTSDKKLRLYSLKDFSKIFEIELTNHGSTNPIFFEFERSLLMLVQATGSSTVNSYYDSESLGGSIELYNIGTIND